VRPISLRFRKHCVTGCRTASFVGFNRHADRNSPTDTPAPSANTSTCTHPAAVEDGATVKFSTRVAETSRLLLAANENIRRVKRQRKLATCKQ